MTKSSQIYLCKSCVYDIFVQIICHAENGLNNFNGKQRLCNSYFKLDYIFNDQKSYLDLCQGYENAPL